MAPHANYPYKHPPQFPADCESFDLSDWMGGDGPLEVVIGPGRGAFVSERCLASPTSRLVGIEIRRKWAQLVDERLRRDGYGGRARVVCGDAKVELPRIAADATIAKFFIQFPDPWWKKRHFKRLVVVDEVLTQVVRLLHDGGELFVQTDVEERVHQYKERIDAELALEPCGTDGAWIDHNPYGALSNRERRATEDGLPIHRLRYRRRPRN